MTRDSNDRDIEDGLKYPRDNAGHKELATFELLEKGQTIAYNARVPASYVAQDEQGIGAEPADFVGDQAGRFHAPGDVVV